MPPPEAVVDGYLIDRLLGRGGTATVYLAYAVALKTRVALKVLTTGHRGPAEIERLRRQYAFAATFHHRHIVDVFDHQSHWLAMQYVDGGNAANLKTLADKLDTLAQIADALDVVHHDGIVHCDVKPANILVFNDFSSKGAVLIDFGAAHSLAEDIAARLSHDAGQRLSLNPARRITHRDSAHPQPVRASLPYAAPEILLGRIPSAASDEYSLACTAVELITGTPPFPETTIPALMDAQLNAAPPKLSQRFEWIPRAADTVVEHAMAKEPERRYANCTEFVDALSRALAHRV